MDAERISYSQFIYKDFAMYIAATDRGLCYIGSLHGDFSELKKWADKNRKGSTLLNDDFVLQPYKEEMERYFAGALRQFSLQTDTAGTPFQESVWHALTQIPYGETVSYQEIAKRIGRPTAVRAVGSAIGKNPVLLYIPCHRVIAKSGKLSGFRGGTGFKQSLLDLEKIHADYIE